MGTKDTKLKATERPTDFGRAWRGVLYHGTCTCCCCLWSLTGGIAGAAGLGTGQSAGERRYGPLPAPVRQALSRGIFAGFVVFVVLSVLIGRSFLGGIGVVIVGLPAILPAMAVCGWIAVALRPAHEATPAALGVVRWALWTMLGMGAAGTLAGIALVGVLVSTETVAVTGLLSIVLFWITNAVVSQEPTAELPSPEPQRRVPSMAPPRRDASSRAAAIPALGPGEETRVPVRRSARGVAPPGTAPPEAPAAEGDVVFLGPTATRASHATCPVCGTPIGPEEPVSCTRCETPHHRDCWDYCGGCAIFGCVPSPEEGAAPLTDAQEVARDWFWSSRVRWWTYLCGATGTAVAPLFYCATANPELAVSTVVFALMAFALFGIASVHELLLRARLEALLEHPIVPSEDALPQLAARLERSRSEPVLQHLAQHAHLLYVLAALVAATAYLTRVSAADRWDGALGGFALVGGFLVALYTARRAKRRAVVVTSVIHRIRASQQLAAQAGPPPAALESP